MDFRQTAQANLEALAANPYPGRGIVIGRSEDGRSLVQVYWIMGRSAHSRNRIFVADGGTVRTEPLVVEELADPSLIIYVAMREAAGHHVVSNGDHTDTLAETIAAGGSYMDALRIREHEPDAPNWTPRIAGGFEARKGFLRAWLGIIKADPTAPNRSLRHFFEYSDFPAGYGMCITTYMGDDDPLPPFVGEPYPVPMPGAVENLLARFWDCLDESNRISIALKYVDLGSGASTVHIMNKYSA